MNYDWKILQNPDPFQEGTLTLWSDSYIAKNVIKKHLDGTIDSGSRKASTIRKTVDWIRNSNPNAERILDVGCGPGLYAPLFEEYDLTYEGFDISPYQIEYAKRYNALSSKSEFYVADFRSWVSKKKYDVVLLLYGIYSFYKRDERINFLKKIRKNLNEDGVVIVEVFTEQHYINRIDSTDWEYIEKNGFWCAAPYLELNAFRRYDKESLILIQAGVLNKTLKIWNSWIQIFDFEELEKEFLSAGFKSFNIFGSCFGSSFSQKSEVLCMCAR